MQVKLEKNILNTNDNIAAKNRKIFKDHDVFVINLLSSPGSGKTSILEKTLELLADDLKIGVVEGDLATTRDAERIAAKGISAVQINTKGACHLDAKMIADVLSHFDLNQLELLIIENVGNLVCPIDFDLGEDLRATVLSITEGNDKIVKYPDSFRETDILLLNKIDLLSFTDFDMETLHHDLDLIHPGMDVFPMSARNGEGVKEWAAWLKEKVQNKIKGLEGK